MVDLEDDNRKKMNFHRWKHDLKTNDRVLQQAAQLEVQARLLRFARGNSDRAITTSMEELYQPNQIAYIARRYRQLLLASKVEFDPSDCTITITFPSSGIKTLDLPSQEILWSRYNAN